MMATNPCNILLVDDEVEFLETLVKRLERRNLSVRTAHCGEEALRELVGNPTDVVVLDVKMPGMDGIEVLREIKDGHPLVEVIMLTGHASVELAIEGMGLGAFDYLVKPVELEELLYKIQDAHARRLLQQAKIRALEGYPRREVRDARAEDRDRAGVDPTGAAMTETESK